MLEERAIDTVVDRRDLKIAVHCNARLHARRLPCLLYHCF
jgi:hypothetical protein